jgi:hypothetical protein
VLVCQVETLEASLGELRDPELKSDLEAFRQRCESMDSFDVGLLLDPVAPYKKRRFGKNRLIAREITVDERRVLVLCEVFKRDDSRYLDFLQNRELSVPDAMIERTARDYVAAASTPRKTLEEPSTTMRGWLTRLSELQTGATRTDFDIHETRGWIRQVQKLFLEEGRGTQLLHKVVLDVIQRLTDAATETDVPIGTVSYEGSGNCYIVWALRDATSICLLDALIQRPTEGQLDYAAQTLLSKNYKADIRRAYPSFATLDEELWMDIQQSEEGNLFLSQDELEMLKSLSGDEGDQTTQEADLAGSGSLPALISGRAGTGKSTMLAYVFAALMQKQARENLSGRPIYVTYNPRLLENARKSIAGLLRSNAQFRASLNTEQQRKLETALGSLSTDYVLSYHDLLRLYLSDEDRQAFLDATRIDFAKFKSAYNGNRGELSPFPNHTLRLSVSAERAWYIIRQFIKGATEHSERLTAEDVHDIRDLHGELPAADRQGVSEEDVAKVFTDVYISWYRPQLEKGRFWDDQDLVSAALEGLKRPAEERPNIAAIVCDEAQDFTSREIRFLVRCCDLLRFNLQRIQPLTVPIVLAGDSLQTLSPSGFRWSAVKAILYEEVWAACGRECNPTNLSLLKNYRSNESIVRFGNLVQLHRKHLFPNREDSREIRPQEAWDISPGPAPLYFKLGLNITEAEIREIAKDKLLLLPCEESGEREFLARDPILGSLVDGMTNDEVTEFLATVLSSAAAKGDEFPEVFLYNFGRHFEDEGFDLRPDRNRVGDFAREFFLNKLYVAASRPRQSLVIIETGSMAKPNEGPSLLWRAMLESAAGGQSASPELSNALLSQNPDFASRVRMAREGGNREWSQSRSAWTPEEAAARLKVGKENSSLEHCLRAAGIYNELGPEFLAKEMEARGWVARFKMEFESSVDYFERGKCLIDAWSVALEGDLWDRATGLLPGLTGAPAREIALVKMMQSSVEDVPAIRNLLEAIAADLARDEFKIDSLWLKAVTVVKTRIQGLLGDSPYAVVPEHLDIEIHELQKVLERVIIGRNGLAALRAELADICAADRAWGEAARHYGECRRLSPFQERRRELVRAHQQGFPEGLRLLINGRLFEVAIAVWDGVGAPMDDARWYDGVESALRSVGDHGRRFEFAIAIGRIGHAFTCLNTETIQKSDLLPQRQRQFVEAAAENFNHYNLALNVIQSLTRTEDEQRRNQLIEVVAIAAVKRWEKPTDFGYSFEPFDSRLETPAVPDSARDALYRMLQLYRRDLGPKVLEPRWHGRALEFAADWRAAWELYDVYTEEFVAPDLQAFCRAGYLRTVFKWGNERFIVKTRGYSTDQEKESREKLKVSMSWRLHQVRKDGPREVVEMYNTKNCRDGLFVLSNQVESLVEIGSEDYQESGSHHEFSWTRIGERTQFSYLASDVPRSWIINHASQIVFEIGKSEVAKEKDGLVRFAADRWIVEVRFGTEMTRVGIRLAAKTKAGKRSESPILIRLRRG